MCIRMALGLNLIVSTPRIASYMRQILRLAWHVTSLAWFGLAGIVVMLAFPPLSDRDVAVAVGVTALASFVSVMAFTRGKHVAAWVLFLVISVVTLAFALAPR